MKNKITRSEFLKHVEIMRKEHRRRDKTDFYLAQIAMEVRRSYVKHPNSVKLEPFYAKWTQKGPDDWKKSKAIWAAHLGVDITPKS